jgi:phosphotransferase system HPr (HPr) family protein
MIQRKLLVRAPLGLHARAAAKVVRLAQSFDSAMELQRIDNRTSADAKSILSVLMLAAGRGTELNATAEGIDEEAAINALDKLFAQGFGEMEQESPG